MVLVPPIGEAICLPILCPAALAAPDDSFVFNAACCAISLLIAFCVLSSLSATFNSFSEPTKSFFWFSNAAFCIASCALPTFNP